MYLLLFTFNLAALTNWTYPDLYTHIERLTPDVPTHENIQIYICIYIHKSINLFSVLSNIY